jgi:hypothetical protein
MRNRDIGQSLVEVAVGMLVLVPVALFLLDVGALVLAQTSNDTLAKNAARAAAEQPDEAKAKAASKDVVDKFGLSTIVSERPTLEMTYNNGQDVIVRTTMKVKLIVPVPFVPQLDNPTFTAQAREAIVATLAE